MPSPLSADFSARVIVWQARQGRHGLPWQNTRDPYRIWLSEIMLQQTQVATVIPYYLRFLERFPDLAALAAADESEVLAHWAGLGYYARARNLHRCARVIAGAHSGHFPECAAGIATLPGIGRSTAAAIAAFAFGERAAILDGNVKRVLARAFGVEGFPGKPAVARELWALAESLLPGSDIETYTQGLMDLGATLCTRTQPACTGCPLRDGCIAARDQRQSELPAAKPRRSVPRRAATFCLFVAGDHILLERRPPAGLWGGLLALPEGEPATLAAARGLTLCATMPLPPLEHAFTHFRLTLHPVRCEVERPASCAEAGAAGDVWLPLAAAADAGVPAPVRRLLTSPDCAVRDT